MKRNRLQLKGKRIILRCHKMSDVDDIVKNINDKRISAWTSHIPYPYNKKDAIQFISKAQYKYNHQKAFELAIVLNDSNKLIGGIALHYVGKDKKQAELGYWVGKKYWDQGYVTEAVDLILNFGFKKLKLHRIQALCFKANKASERVMIKSGLKKEGEIRECTYRLGSWHNILRYSILDSECK